MTGVMWFRRDLRLEDNKALFNAIASKQPIVCIFHINPEQLVNTPSTNQTAFFKSVLHLKETMANYQITLHILYGDLITCFAQLKQQLPHWSDIYFNYDEAGFGRERDKLAATFFRKNGIKIHTYQDHYLHGSQDILNKLGQSYQVFTPYYRVWESLEKELPIVIDLAVGKWKSIVVDKKAVQQLEILATGKSFYKPGTIAAYEQLHHFIDKHITTYDVNRDFPSIEGTSRLSYYLRSGEISIRSVYHAVNQAPSSTGKTVFIKELAWRDFYNMIHVNFPNQKTKAIQSHFQHIYWENNIDLFNAWKSGKTGYPIIDAAMKQLIKTGWLHNRLRMIVASFLTKDLLIDWRWGEKYFQEMLVDYDASSNIGGWQWAASTGTDAVPYFRIFNPILQSKKFDENGDFIKLYLPQLYQVPLKYIHEPWKMPIEVQKEVHCIIGIDYPYPTVDHAIQRQKAIQMYEEAKEHYIK